jgi:phosphotransferase system HPr-like phosphotransfer protein
MKIGLFVDVQNLYFQAIKKHTAKIDYSQLLEFCKDFGDIVIKNAYVDRKEGNEKFIIALEEMGYEIKDGNKVQLTLDAKDAQVDLIIICSNDQSFVPLYNTLKKVLVLCVNKNTLKGVETMEIPQSVMLN